MVACRCLADSGTDSAIDSGTDSFFLQVTSSNFAKQQESVLQIQKVKSEIKSIKKRGNQGCVIYGSPESSVTENERESGRAPLE